MKQYSSKLQTTIVNINKVYGVNTIIDLNGKPVEGVAILCSSGSIKLNDAMGGGYPEGRIIEIYGPESSGKTTLALHAIAEVQKEGGYAAMIDAEHSVDLFYAQNIGVNVDNLLFAQPSSGEEALETTEMLVDSGEVRLIVVDSVAALIPQAEIDGEMGDSKVALQARLMSQAMRKLASKCNINKCTIIFINQLREKIGTCGNAEVTTGGNALKFYASIRVDIRRVSINKTGTGENEEATSNTVKVKIVKNKIAPPFKVVELDIIFGQGISRESELIDLAVKFGILIANESSGIMLGYDSLFYPNILPLEYKKDRAAIALNENPLLKDLKEEIEWSIKLADSKITSEEFMINFDERYKKAEQNKIDFEKFWLESSYYSGKSLHEESLFYCKMAEHCAPFDKAVKTKIKTLEKKISEKKDKKIILKFKDGSEFNIETGEAMPAIIPSTTTKNE